MCGWTCGWTREYARGRSVAYRDAVWPQQGHRIADTAISTIPGRATWFQSQICRICAVKSTTMETTLTLTSHSLNTSHLTHFPGWPHLRKYSTCTLQHKRWYTPNNTSPTPTPGMAEACRNRRNRGKEAEADYLCIVTFDILRVGFWL